MPISIFLDVEELMNTGIAAVLGPGASAEEVVTTVQNAISARDKA